MSPLPARVLVDLPNWLGDFVHALPALAALLAANRGGETWVLVPASHAPLARLLGVGVIERPAGAAFGFGRGLRSRFDVALTARHSTRAKLLLTGTAAPRALASRGRGAATLGLATFSVERGRHQRHDLDHALRALGVPFPDDGAFLLPLPAALAARGGRVRHRLAGGAPAVALLPATRGGNGKQYPVERFARVAEALARTGTRTIVVVGPGEEPLAAMLAGPTGIDVAPAELALDETAALLSACDAALGNDSGLTHLAAAVGCPTVALFGPTDPGRTAPAPPAIVVRAEAPSHGRGAPCVAHLGPDTVVAAVRAVLSPRRPAPAERPPDRAKSGEARERESPCAQREATL